MKTREEIEEMIKTLEKDLNKPMIPKPAKEKAAWAAITLKWVIDGK